MAPATSYSRGATVVEAREALEIHFPAPRYALAIFVLPISLGGWLAGMVIAIQALLSGTTDPNRTPVIVWLTGWGIGGLWAVATSLWMLAGRQIVRLAHHRLSVRWEMLGVGYTKDYDTRQVRSFRVAPMPARAGPRWGWGGGPFTFEYGKRSVRFGLSLDEAEAASLLPQLQRMLPVSSAG